MKFTRRSGVLLHPTSFPGTPGIGTLGQNAIYFADWLQMSGQSLWQILPLGPTGYGDSPYASFSTFAGNPILIDLDSLAKRGWADEGDIKPPDYIKTTGNVDYGSVVWWKTPVLFKCAKYFLKHCTEKDRTAYEAFKNDNAYWLNSYADFTSIKGYYDAKAKKEGVEGAASMWNAYWPKDLAAHDDKAVSDWDSKHTENVEEIKAIQFFFASQWSEVKRHANTLGIDVIGDIPIFVAADSSDVWANQKMFQLKDGVPLQVAGVPPDYFSATGQLWGNPLYDWDAMKKDGYSWWIARIKRCLDLVDCVRIDHFRGFEAYWSVPYGDKTAEKGKWIKGPGIDLFNAIKAKLGSIPVIAEDLGVITEGVKKLRKETGFPGMKVLQFAFDKNEAGKEGMTNAFLPHMFDSSNYVVYTGTHDNDTMQGWLDKADDDEVRLVAEYIRAEKVSKEDARKMANSGKLTRDMIKLSMASNAVFSVTPMQDILDMDNSCRMNTPSTTGANWAWRMKEGSLTEEKSQWLSFLSRLYGRA